MSIDDLFELQEDTAWDLLGKAATYTPAGDDAVDITVIPRMPVQDLNLGDSVIRADQVTFQVRASEVADPAAGDTLEYDGTTYTVKGEPRYADDRRRVWNIEVRP